MDIGLLITSTLPQVILEVVKVVDIGLLRPDTLPELIMKAIDIGFILLATLPLLNS